MTTSVAAAAPPLEVFPVWRLAQREVSHLARQPLLAPAELRTTGHLTAELAHRVIEWFTGPSPAPVAAVQASYRALEQETAQLWQVIRDVLGIRVQYTHGSDDPYVSAVALTADLRRHRTMKLRTIACDAPHPLLGGLEGGVVDQLRIVHDVFGHAALGLGFDLQSEYAAWLQCRTLFSAAARPAAFCELVGAVTTYIASGSKPGLRADLPPADLLAACASRDAGSEGRVLRKRDRGRALIADGDVYGTEGRASGRN
jgi:hypothetical protein